MILIIDNYDSFTYNLVDIVSQIDEVIIKYPDDKDVFNYLEKIDGVIISPGPGHPLDDDELVKLSITSYFTNFRYLFRCSSINVLLRWQSYSRRESHAWKGRYT